MAAPRPLHRMSTVDVLTDALRREILDGGIPAGAWLRERELVEPRRGARVAELADEEVRWPYELHAALHTAIVQAARSPRIALAHGGLGGEMRRFLLALQPYVPADQLAADHRALIDGLETGGPEALREHLRRAAETLT